MASRSRTDLSEDELELDFLRCLAERRPGDVNILKALGDQLTHCGCYAEGLAVDERLAACCHDDDTVHYNLACSLALMGRPEEALAALARAVALGYDDDEHAAEDGDLATLHSDPRFAELLLSMRDSAAAGGD